MTQTSYEDAWQAELARSGEVRDEALVMVAESMIAARRALQPVLPAELIHDSALDMLLTLFVADGRGLPRGTVEQATTVSPSVAKRWIDALVQRDLVERDADLVALTDQGREAMTIVLTSVIRSQQQLHGARDN